jgi:hypothetical protein
VYRASSKDGKPDVLSRYLEYSPEEGEEPITLLKPEQIMIATATIYHLLIKRLDENLKLSIRGSDLATSINIMAN